MEEAKIDAKKEQLYSKKRTVYEGDTYFMLTPPDFQNLKWNNSNKCISVVLGKTADINNTEHYLFTKSEPYTKLSYFRY